MTYFQAEHHFFPYFSHGRKSLASVVFEPVEKVKIEHL